MCILSNPLLCSILLFCGHSVSFTFASACDTDFMPPLRFQFPGNHLFSSILLSVILFPIYPLLHNLPMLFFINTMMSSTVLGMLQNITFRDALSQSHEAMAPEFPNSRSHLTRRIRVALGLGLLHSISTQTSSHTGNNYKKQKEYETVLKTLDTRQQRAVNADSQQTGNTQGEPCNCP